MVTVTPLLAFHDNYIWAIVDPARASAAIVDPGDANPVLHFLEKQALSLEAILITHHHYDHTNGVKRLLSYHDSRVYGPANSPLTEISDPLEDADSLELFDSVSLQVITTPGHTLDHIAYHDATHLFCGDTLFSAGCGRLFEGTAQQLFNSLTRLKRLDPNTKVYCAHEYTLANLRFAKTVEPDNDSIEQRYTEVEALRDLQQPSLPSTIGLELITNPFFRCDSPSIRDSVSRWAKKDLTTEEEVFTELRLWKDNF